MAKKIEYEKSLLAKKPALTDEWDYDKNVGLRPEDVAAFSHKKVWWKCGKGHTWQARIQGRSNGNGCPYCNGSRAIPNETDFFSLHPELMNEWHWQKNKGVDPRVCSEKSGKSVWWKCSLKSCGYPEIAKQWHPTMNGETKPSETSSKSNKYAWWCCEHGHEWRTKINNRTSNSTGCPFCSGTRVIKGETDLASQFPEIALQWNLERNGNLKPDEVSAKSNRYVWWRCNKGHEWKTKIYHRTDGRGCPFCAGQIPIPGETDLAAKNPVLASEWNFDKNCGQLPQDVTTYSHKKVWWKCSCGHEWQASVYNVPMK